MIQPRLILALCLIASPIYSSAQTADTIVPEPEISVQNSEACRIAVEAFPLEPALCSEQLATTSNQTLQAELASYLAIGYARTNLPTDARAAIEQALATDPEHWLVHANHGVMLLYLNDFRSASDAINQALSLTEQPIPDLYLNLALAARGSGDFSTAKNAYGTYLDLMGYRTTDAISNTEEDAYGPPERTTLEQRFSGDPFKATRRIEPR